MMNGYSMVSYKNHWVKNKKNNCRSWIGQTGVGVGGIKQGVGVGGIKLIENS